MNLSNRTKWALALLLLLPMSPAGAEEVGEAGCRVLELPAVISEPGHYCLQRDWDLDLFGGGFAIEIRSDYVVVDFQGHQVRNLPGLVVGEIGWATYGVYAWERSHIAVRNGTLAGFRYGIVISEEAEDGTTSRNHLVEKMRIHFCQRAGILLGAQTSVIRDNIIGDITGIGHPEVTGILVLRGGGNRVLGNEISRVLGSKSAIRWGIRFEGGNRNLAAGNRLYSTWKGILMDYQTVYRDNFVLEMPSGNPAFSGGTDAGGNFWN